MKKMISIIKRFLRFYFLKWILDQNLIILIIQIYQRIFILIQMKIKAFCLFSILEGKMKLFIGKNSKKIFKIICVYLKITSRSKILLSILQKGMPFRNLTQMKINFYNSFYRL
ncbi:hypothetical protein IMG5_019010 [Ichthyophthirius multifiliis]|uniref:Transmembrane protein n=1 Tax=Ichthyophthirius multifiliis TaxID=5932 RepID=G0QKK3_ICHMU|nr:hypothetical protein IMG5_019010 [Ichthyophthirius multifiliis]EGR34254.1 hypothetical protein IMG5_019010 [Ichthyophthirius multifiliis]|eukprot:XP_004039558.1 hypothetical protein IMG5_019010 [Ichthyophthirius multifiliis]